ncbi:hypothetical protein D9M68_789200 [compost metagenome]
MGQRPLLRIGHRDQLEALAQTLQCLHRVREGRPLRHRIAQSLRERIAVGQAQRGCDGVPAALQVIGVPARVAVGASGPVGGQEVIVSHGRIGHCRAQVCEHAALEIDQRADHVEREDLEILQGHTREAPVGGQEIAAAATGEGLPGVCTTRA